MSTSIFQPLRLGVARVHPEEIRREERRLLAALAAPDLEDGVLLVVRIGRQEQELDRRLERARARRCSSGSSACASSRSSGSAEGLLVVADLPLDVAVARERVDDRLEIAALLVELRRAARGRRARRAGRGAPRARRSGARAARACRSGACRPPARTPSPRAVGARRAGPRSWGRRRRSRVAAPPRLLLAEERDAQAAPARPRAARRPARPS